MEALKGPKLPVVTVIKIDDKKDVLRAGLEETEKNTENSHSHSLPVLLLLVAFVNI